MPWVSPGDGDISPELLDACRRGEHDALRTLYEAYKDRVYSIAYYYFHGDAATAADVTQQVFLKVMRQLHEYRGDSAFRTWLYRVVLNACVDRARRVQREPIGTDPAVLDAFVAPGRAHDDLFARDETAHHVKAAIAALPAKLRAAILLRYFEDLSYAEMAATLHCSIGTVSSRLSRGHRLLARRLSALRPAGTREGDDG